MRTRGGSLAQIPGSRVVFGTLDHNLLTRELENLNSAAPLFIATLQQGDMLRSELGRLNFTNPSVFAEAAMHTPVAVTEACLRAIEQGGNDGLVAFGGGSAIGLAKAVAFRTDMMQMAIPTSFAGSEMTNILGETDESGKTTRRSPAIQPETVIYDERFYASMPQEFAMTSGLNALAHAVEGLYAPDGMPATDAIALDSARLLIAGLPGMVREPGESAPLRQAMTGAHLAGLVLGSVAMSLHHKICHVLGGLYNLPHAQLHSVMLPYVVAYNQPEASDALAPLAGLLGGEDAGRKLHELALALGAPPSLEAIGFDPAAIAIVVEELARNPYSNPRALETNALTAMLRDAAIGAAPSEYH